MAIRTRTRKVGIRVRKRVNPLPPTAHERGHKSVLLRRDIIDLDAEEANNSIQHLAKQKPVEEEEGEREQCNCKRRGRFNLRYHLSVGEEGNIGDGLEGLRHAVEVGAAAVAHVGVEHGLGDVLGVVLFAPVELVLQVVDAVLLLVPGHARAPCKQHKSGVRTRAAAGETGRDGRPRIANAGGRGTCP